MQLFLESLWLFLLGMACIAELGKTSGGKRVRGNRQRRISFQSLSFPLPRFVQMFTSSLHGRMACHDVPPYCSSASRIIPSFLPVIGPRFCVNILTQKTASCDETSVELREAFPSWSLMKSFQESGLHEARGLGDPNEVFLQPLLASLNFHRFSSQPLPGTSPSPLSSPALLSPRLSSTRVSKNMSKNK